ncbi:MAG: RagB/SusD family nutrient uptake outer membrane protein [Labilibaculum sp.]|nr:RagB/SusD family nutrient uptake outer membrane protein [Labilibaculum sp.]MBI9059055.1 RagB/SusD family nutrient uptake outer membrane protein [Labilibaculum sp.]
MKKYLRLFSFITILTVGMVSCSEDFVHLEPNDQLSNATVFGNKKGITGAVNGAMAQLIDNGGWYRYALTLQGDALGGNLKTAANAGTSRWQSELVYNYTPSSSNLSLWSNAYSACAVINQIIAKVEGVGDMTDEEKKQVKGQALFLRALAHFDLCKVFAQPYSLNDSDIAKGANGDGGHLGVLISADEFLEDKPARSTLKECYTQIINDLLEAEKLLSDEFEVFLPTKLATEALLSRVYLYKNDFANSLTYSNKVIGNSANRVLLDAASYIPSWVEDYSSESILTAHVYKTHPNFPGNGETLFDLLEENGTYGDLSITNDLYSLIGDDDVRKGLYYLDSRDAEVIRTSKYPSEESNVPILRLSEIYLNKAEAEYHSNQTAALTTLNTFRAKRGLSELSLSGVDLLNAIYAERRIELCGEGHAIFDLVRTQRDLVRVDFVDHANKDISYPSKLFVLPIPEEELNGNPNCEQNPF